MSEVNDGGPAFPVNESEEHTGTLDGMTLRDYFAAKAISSCCENNPASFSDRVRRFLGLDYTIGGTAPESAAIRAYRIADAMLEQRDQDNAN